MLFIYFFISYLEFALINTLSKLLEIFRIVTESVLLQNNIIQEPSTEIRILRMLIVSFTLDRLLQHSHGSHHTGPTSVLRQFIPLSQGTRVTWLLRFRKISSPIDAHNDEDLCTLASLHPSWARNYLIKFSFCETSTATVMAPTGMNLQAPAILVAHSRDGMASTLH